METVEDLPIRLTCQCSRSRFDVLMLHGRRLWRRVGGNYTGRGSYAPITIGDRRWAPVWGVRDYECEKCNRSFRLGEYRLRMAVATAAAMGRRSVSAIDAAHFEKRPVSKRLLARLAADDREPSAR